MASRTIATILSMKDQFTAPAKKATSSVKNMNREMQKTKNQIKRFAKEAKQKFNEVAKASINMAKNTAKIGTGIATTIGTLATKAGFSEAFNLEGYKVQLETAVKDTNKAAKLMSNAIAFANKTPFETGEVVEATSKMEMYGLSSKRWLSDIADMAGSTNKSIEQATEAMVDAAIGEFERLKEFGIQKDEILMEAAKKYGENVVFNTKGQLLDQEKMLTVVQEIMQKKYKGGAEKLSKTAKGLWSTITGVTKNALAKIVGMNEDGTIRQGSLYDKLKQKIKAVADTLQKWQQDGTIDKIRANVESAVNKISAGLKFVLKIIDNIKEGFGFWDGVATPVLEKIDDLLYSTFSKEKADLISNIFHTAFGVLDDVINNAKRLYNFITKNWGTISPIIWTVVGALVAYKTVMIGEKVYKSIATGIKLWRAATKSQTTAQWLLNSAMAANPIGVVIGAIAALIIIGILLYKNWDKIKEKAKQFGKAVIGIWNNLKIKIEEVWVNVANFLGSFPLGEAFLQNIINIVNATKKIWNGIITFITGVFTGNWKQAWEGVKKIFSGIFEGLVALVKTPFNTIIGYINTLIEAINNLSFNIPEWVSKIPGVPKDLAGKTIGFNIPKIPNFAMGTSYFNGGLAQINERGGEIVNLPNGSTIIPADKSQRIIEKAKGSPIIVNIYGNVYGEDDLINKVGKAIYDQIELQLSNIP